MKRLVLKREMLSELTVDELVAVVGGAESDTCPQTFTCGITCTSVSYQGCNITGKVDEILRTIG